jgi:hypothetical protein
MGGSYERGTPVVFTVYDSQLTVYGSRFPLIGSQLQPPNFTNTTLTPKPQPLNPAPKFTISQPQTLDPNSQILNPQPQHRVSWESSSDWDDYEKVTEGSSVHLHPNPLSSLVSSELGADKPVKARFWHCVETFSVQKSRGTPGTGVSRS